jgi:CBS domain-containing protein
MRVQDLMTRHPVCCRMSDTAQSVAKILRDEDIGCVPVVSSEDSKRIEGVITDRDLCCSIIAAGLDPKTTAIGSFVTRNPVTCRPEQSLDSCARLMQVHQIRRVLIINRDMECVGIVSQADMARWEDGQRVHRTLEEISRPSQMIKLPAAG